MPAPENPLQRAHQLFSAGKFQQARALYLSIIRTRPNNCSALTGLGNIAVHTDMEAAARFFSRAIQADPNDPAPRLNLARIAFQRGRHKEGIAMLHEAARCAPRSALVQKRLAEAYVSIRAFDEALPHRRRAVELGGDDHEVFRDLVYAKRTVCDWQDCAADERVVLDWNRAGDVTNPMAIMSLGSTLEDQLIAARNWAARYVNQTPVSRPQRAERPSKVRVGYLSNDFRPHATAYLIPELLRNHDRTRFEVHLLSYGGGGTGEVQTSLIDAADGFTDLSGLSDRSAAEAIAKTGIDILIDMKGYTLGARPGILACRPAPIQANYLGFPGTMGASFIDYVICDQQVCPFDYQPWCDEKIVHLDFFQPSPRERGIRAQPFTRQELGLPAEAFVFCTFAAAYKLTPTLFELWTRILGAVPGSVLWTFARTPNTKANLLKAAAQVGLDADRIVFADFMSQEPHLRRIQLADLMLDTLPVSGFTTASDAVWAGLPVLTCTGTTAAGRGTTSVLTAAGVPELITNSLEEYEARAVALAKDRLGMMALRERLRMARTQSRVFDGAAHARALEKAFTEMLRRHDDRLPPAPFATDEL